MINLVSKISKFENRSKKNLTKRMFRRPKILENISKRTPDTNFRKKCLEMRNNRNMPRTGGAFFQSSNFMEEQYSIHGCEYTVCITAYFGKKHKFLEKTINHELKKIDHRVRANKLCINYSKSNFMLMNNHKNINFSVSINHHQYQNKAA